MTLHDPRAYTRRAFLSRGVAMASASLSVPAFLNASAFGLPFAAPDMSSIPGVPEDHVLVVVQLSGGNDGLNTVIPYGDPAYYRARPGIGLRENTVLRVSEPLGLGVHPSMTGLKELYDDGMCTIVQGVGYPNPNRSHFMSMDIWHTADTDATGDGWLGRYFDSQCCGYGAGESGTDDGSMNPGIAIGREAPLAMQGSKVKPIAFETPELFTWTGKGVHDSLSQPYHELIEREREPLAGGSNTDFLMRTAMDAQVSSEMIRKAVERRPSVQYPNTPIGQQMSMIASMIAAGLKTRVYYASHGGFDTHAGQGGQYGNHARLLEQFASAVRAFYADLREQENQGRVLTMSFSEFGRRVGQNASGGTDHGTAAPMFLFGPMVRAGIHGRHPSLTDLDNGDLKFNTDFRTVYAAILEEWLAADSKKILGGSYRPAKVLNLRG
ncbi:MAG: DUF1501 domain-containing protein [Phycisphaerales bacterium JB037]